MNSLFDYPKPLTTPEFYLLLALANTTHHKYAIKALIHNLSLGSITLTDTQLSRLITKLEAEIFIEPVGPQPTGKSGQPRLHYAITAYGSIRLQEETQRLDYAIKVAKHAGVLDNQTPTDIQRLLLDVRSSVLKSSS